MFASFIKLASTNTVSNRFMNADEQTWQNVAKYIYILHSSSEEENKTVIIYNSLMCSAHIKCVNLLE